MLANNIVVTELEKSIKAFGLQLPRGTCMKTLFCMKRRCHLE